MQFLIEHGEKFVVAVIGIFALYLAMQGLGYQALSWQPNELEQMATEAENAIRASTRTVDGDEIKIFDYAAHADQIKKPIPAAPYRIPAGAEWEPVLGASPSPPRAEVQQNPGEPSSEPAESPATAPSQDEPQ